VDQLQGRSAGDLNDNLQFAQTGGHLSHSLPYLGLISMLYQLQHPLSRQWYAKGDSDLAK